MAPLLRVLAADIFLAKGAVTERGAERTPALPKNLLAMGDEQELEVSPLLAEPPVIQSSDDRLSCARGGNYEITKTAVALSFRVQLLKDSALVRAGLYVNESEVDFPIGPWSLRGERLV